MLGASDDGLCFLRWLVQATEAASARFLAPEQAAFREGQRAVGCAVLELCIMAGIAQAVLEKEGGENE